MGGQKGEGNRRGARAGGMENGGARGRTDVCVCAQKGEGDRRGGGRIGGGRRQENERAGGLANG